MLSKLGSFVVKFATLILFLAVCYVALFFAYGYQYDAKKQDVKKTSIIDLIGNTREARISLNGQFESNFLPYQIKSVDPGNYELNVSKAGFLPWKRNISVEEDLVTIVNDILLVPSDLQPYTRLIKDFGETESLNFGTDIVFGFDTALKNVHLLDLFYDGTYKEEDLGFDADAVKTIETLDNDRFLVTDNANLTHYLDFKHRKFGTFYKPGKSYGYKINADGDLIYFFIGRTLFNLDLNVLNENSKGFLVEKNKVADNVDAISFGFNGQIYFISGNVAYRTDSTFLKKEPLNLSLNGYKNLSFLSGSNFGYLILRTTDDKRMLYIVDKKGRFNLLGRDIEGKPFVNGFDQLLFEDISGGLFYYDANLKEKVTVMVKEKPVEILGWFSDEGHFIFREDGMIRLGDVFNANKYDLTPDKGITKIFVFSKNIFYVKDNRVMAINWRSLL